MVDDDEVSSFPMQFLTSLNAATPPSFVHVFIPQLLAEITS